MRLFVSVDLPDELVAAVREVQKDLEPASGIRPIDPTQTHVTLKFLGEVDRDRLEPIVDGLEHAIHSAGVPPFEAQLEGLGVFPSLEYISVVWVGFSDGTAELTALHEAVEAQLVERGFSPEEHDFTPHATIARMDHAGGKELVQRLVRDRHPTIGRMTVNEIRLTESRLEPDGPEYETVYRFTLPDASE